MPPDLAARTEMLIASAASKFPSTGDFEARMQAGRLAFHAAASLHRLTAGNFDDHANFLWVAVARAMARPPASADSAPVPTVSDPLEFHVRTTYGRSLSSLVSASGEEGVLHRLARDSLNRKASDDAVRAVTWHLVAMNGLPVAEIPRKLDYAMFVRNGLAGFESYTRHGAGYGWLWVRFNNSPFRAINHAYPGRFLPHDMTRVPKRYWSGLNGRARAVAALRTSLESTGHPEADFPRIVTERFLEEFKLTSPLQKRFGSHFKYLDAAYPGRYRPWEMAVTPRGYFDRRANVVAAVKWLVEEKLGIPMSDAPVKTVWKERYAEKVTKEAFDAHGLREIMATYGSPEPVMRMAYPGKFLDWSFQKKSKWSGPGGRRLAAKATRWLIEDYLRIDPLSERITCETFRRNGLWGMLTARQLGFNSSPFAALKNAYPRLSSRIRRPAIRGRTRPRRPLPAARRVGAAA